MADNKATTTNANGMKVDTKLIRQLAEMLADTGLTEIVYNGDALWDGEVDWVPFTGGGITRRPLKYSEPQLLDKYGRRVRTEIDANADYVNSAYAIRAYLIERSRDYSWFGPLPWTDPDNSIL